MSRYERRWGEKRTKRRNDAEDRYTPVFSRFWSDPDTKTLTLDERHLLLTLCTGRQSTQAGIMPFNLDAIIRDFSAAGYRPTRDELMGLLEGLAKKPNASRPFVMFDEDTLWICSQLADERQKPNENHIRGIRSRLSQLPRDSKVVRAFFREYADLLGEGPAASPAASPEPYPEPYPEGDLERREGLGENQQPRLASLRLRPQSGLRLARPP
jgi:hypothetical protein